MIDKVQLHALVRGKDLQKGCFNFLGKIGRDVIRLFSSGCSLYEISSHPVYVFI